MSEERDWNLKSIFHFTVSATNFETSINFYQSIGFRVLRDNRDVVWPDYVAKQFGMNVAQGRGALLAVDDGELHTRLDLIEWIAPEPEPPSTRPMADRVPRIIALRTHNVRAAYEELRAKGVEFMTEPRGPEPQTGIEAVVCCRDPDGLLVEFIEYMPGVLGSRVQHLETREESK